LSELDFIQKLDLRRAFWAMGASTRLNVKLSALVNQRASKGKSSVEEWTDLDVLAIQYAPLTGVSFAVADCKTSKSRATERVFWLRGVADLFGARSAYLSRSSGIPSAARQLALRLRIQAIDSLDRAQLLEQAGAAQLPAAGQFFDAGAYRKWEAIIAAGPSELDKLRRYGRTFYWVLPKHRNLTLLPSYLGEAARFFDPRQQWAIVLLIDLSWLYLLSVLHAVEEVSHLHLAAMPASLRQVVVGSEQEIREKEQLARRIQELISFADERRSREAPEVPVLPKYFDDLLDLVSRAARRRVHANQALRILEFTGIETISNRGARWVDAFPNSDALAGKLASDVIRFLCRAAGLSTDFVNAFDASLDGKLGLGTADASERDLEAQPTLFAGHASSSETARRQGGTA
jgi:hypothetical protein